MISGQSFNRSFIAISLCGLIAGCSSRAETGTSPDVPALSAQGGVVDFANPGSPLGHAFEEFHFETILDCMSEVMGDIRAYAVEAHPDRPAIVLSGNPAGGMHIPRWVELAAPFDYFNIECDVVRLHDGSRLAHFLGIAALSESVNTTLLVMPDASSNKSWNKQENPQAYAGATGLSYALGGHMHVPWCLYDGSQFNRFYGSLDGHQPIFSMIHEHADWFDGYVPALWHVLEVPYGRKGVDDLAALETQVLGFYKAGVPTVLRLKGTTAPMASERFSGEPRLRNQFDPGKGGAQAESPFEMDSAFQSGFLPPIPRVHHETSKAPLTLHIIRRFDDASSAPASGHFTVSPAFLQGAEVVKVEIAAPEWPDRRKASVSWETIENGDLEVRVEAVPAWAILRVHTKEPVKLPGVKRPSLRNAMAESEIPLMRMIRFSDTWARPQWVDEALASESDPLGGYHITRISWSYDNSLQTLRYAQAKGMAFHGSGAFLHAYMAVDGKPPQEGVPTTTPGWPGWVRYPDGHPMHIRPDWNPPRYGASFASQEYRMLMIERGIQWIDKGAAGIQFDDISGMVNRVWKYGGDYSDAFFLNFRNYLVEHDFQGVNAETPLEALRKRVMKEMGYTPPHERESDGTIIVHKPTNTGYPGLVWVGPTAPFARTGGLFSAEFTFRVTSGDTKGIDLLLMDGDRTVYLSRIPLAEVLPADAGEGEWITLRVRHDLDAEITRVGIGGNGEWGTVIPFKKPLLPQMRGLSPVLLVDPSHCGVEVQDITIMADRE